MLETTRRPSDSSVPRKPLRLWPGVVIVTLQWLMRYALPVFVPEAMPVGAIGGMLGGVAIVVWWVGFSRAAWVERLGAIALMGASLVGASQLLHPSVATAGMGFLFPMYAVPLLCLLFVGWALSTRHLSDGHRRMSMVATIVVAGVGWTLVRTGGITGNSHSDFQWRWTATAEERLLALADAVPSASRSDWVTDEIEADWPGFRGTARDGVIRGLRIETDWSASPPVELWRRPVGPGWSSFSVLGDLLFTQEQRGDEELVSAYAITTGEPVWRHRDPARFYESNGGAGPRATPTLRDGRVYAFGATGILNVLDASDGSVVWSRNAGSDTGVRVPFWGFSSSPLVVDDVVIVATAGRLVGYDLETGEPRWFGPEHNSGYSSPHPMTIDGVEQILLLSGHGATSVTPSDGAVLWEHAWSGGPIVQPARTADGDVLFSTVGDAAGIGTRRLGVTHGPDGWSVEERWTSIRLKPYFNDFVVHEGHAYGFDGSILACMDVADGNRAWKGGRYGNGQLILLPEQDLLLVLSEEGELVLVAAKPDGFTELARAPALEGKTWNHPVLVGDVLLVRNGEEMAAVRLALPDS